MYKSLGIHPLPPFYRFTDLHNARTHGVFACQWMGEESLPHSLAQGSIKVELGSTNAQDPVSNGLSSYLLGN